MTDTSISASAVTVLRYELFVRALEVYDGDTRITGNSGKDERFGTWTGAWIG